MICLTTPQMVLQILWLNRVLISDHELNAFLQNVSIVNNCDVARREQQQFHEMTMYQYQWVDASSSRLLKLNQV